MLEIRGLGYRRGDFSLELSLELGRGELGVLLGPSGSGKSTLLRIIAGLLEAETGSIRLGGRDLAGLPPEKRRVGMVFQGYALFPHLSVRRNIEYGPRVAGSPAPRRAGIATELARELRIEGLLGRKPSEISGGEAQRVALARSLAADPELLLLDEPLSSLDQGLRRELRGLIGAELRSRGMTALHVTHDVEEALALADRVFLMRAGRIVETGTAEELYLRPASAFAARFFGRGPVIPVLSVEASGGRLAVSTPLGGIELPSTALAPGARDGAALALTFPADSARPQALSRESLDRDALHFEAVLRSSGFSGRSRRLLVEAEGLALELETEPDFRGESGVRLGFRVPAEHCRLVREL